MTLPSALHVSSERRNGTAHRPGVGVLLSEVAPRRVEWLWAGRVPKGKLTLLESDPGTGKSAMIMDLAARVSSGRDMPDGTRGGAAAGVVILSAEDDLADTVRPRLDAAGGDTSRILALTTNGDEAGDRLPSLPEEIPLIEQGIERVGAELVIIDPLVAYFGGKIDSHRDQDVRRVLAALAALAGRTGAAVLVVRHLNKAGGGNPLYRGGGFIGIIAAARSGLLLAKDPENEDLRVLAVNKGNLAKPAQNLAFLLEEADNGAVRVAWQGESSASVGQLLGANHGGEGDSRKLEMARAFLLESWGVGRYQPSTSNRKPRRRGSLRGPWSGRSGNSGLNLAGRAQGGSGLYPPTPIKTAKTAKTG